MKIEITQKNAQRIYDIVGTDKIVFDTTCEEAQFFKDIITLEMLENYLYSENIYINEKFNLFFVFAIVTLDKFDFQKFVEKFDIEFESFEIDGKQTLISNINQCMIKSFKFLRITEYWDNFKNLDIFENLKLLVNTYINIAELSTFVEYVAPYEKYKFFKNVCISKTNGKMQEYTKVPQCKEILDIFAIGNFKNYVVFYDQEICDKVFEQLQSYYKIYKQAEQEKFAEEFINFVKDYKQYNNCEIEYTLLFTDNFEVFANDTVLCEFSIKFLYKNYEGVEPVDVEPTFTIFDRYHVGSVQNLINIVKSVRDASRNITRMQNFWGNKLTITYK
jgi:hypothetical protein